MEIVMRKKNSEWRPMFISQCDVVANAGYFENKIYLDSPKINNVRFIRSISSRSGKVYIRTWPIYDIGIKKNMVNEYIIDCSKVKNLADIHKTRMSIGNIINVKNIGYCVIMQYMHNFEMSVYNGKSVKRLKFTKNNCYELQKKPKKTSQRK